MREATGALVLALRSPDGSFTTNPTGDTVVQSNDVVIAVGTADDFERLAAYADPTAKPSTR